VTAGDDGEQASRNAKTRAKTITRPGFGNGTVSICLLPNLRGDASGLAQGCVNNLPILWTMDNVSVQRGFQWQVRLFVSHRPARAGAGHRNRRKSIEPSRNTPSTACSRQCGNLARTTRHRAYKMHWEAAKLVTSRGLRTIRPSDIGQQCVFLNAAVLSSTEILGNEKAGR
jgi:hypothetical protein